MPQEEEVESSLLLLPSPHSEEGIRLAEDGDWDTLLTRLKTTSALAYDRDEYGMLPLHWVCTEETAPTALVAQLLTSYPDSVNVKNEAQLLPLHIAVRSNSSAATISLLCDANPRALYAVTTQGKRPLMLAQEVELSLAATYVLEEAERAHPEATLVRRSEDLMSQEGTSSKTSSHGLPGVLSDHRVSVPTIGPTSSRRSLGTTTRLSAPNLSERHSESSRASEGVVGEGGCGMCGKKSGTFEKKRVCFGCGKTLCKNHVAGRIEFQASSTKQIVCADCFARQSQGHESPIPMLSSTDDEGMRSSSSTTMSSRLAQLEQEKETVERQLKQLQMKHDDMRGLLVETMDRVAELESHHYGLASSVSIQLPDDITNSPFDDTFSSLPPRLSYNTNE